MICKGICIRIALSSIIRYPHHGLVPAIFKHALGVPLLYFFLIRTLKKISNKGKRLYHYDMVKPSIFDSVSCYLQWLLLHINPDQRPL